MKITNATNAMFLDTLEVPEPSG